MRCYNLRKEGERERQKEGERERRKSAGERGTRELESIHPETDLRNPSQPTDTQNWDSVIVSSVRCTLKRQEFAKGNPRIDFTLSFKSALDNINYNDRETFSFLIEAKLHDTSIEKGTMVYLSL